MANRRVLGYESRTSSAACRLAQPPRSRAWLRGIRLAADMVPNHVGIDGQWVMNHPTGSSSRSTLRIRELPLGRARPFDRSARGRVPRAGLILGTCPTPSSSKRVDRHTGEERFIGHGNDGTSMPWNDTAQLRLLEGRFRRRVSDHPPRRGMFDHPAFDAAMTLHVTIRFSASIPLPPGGGGAIPSA